MQFEIVTSNIQERMSPVTTTQSDEASRTISKVSIASQYTHCKNSFNKLLECTEASNNQVIAQRLSNEFGRLRIWAGNSGAHRSGRVSLDHRLREASHLHEELTKLLGELHQDLEEGEHFPLRHSSIIDSRTT